MGVLTFQVFLRHDATHPLGVLNRAGYSYYALTAGIVMFVSIMISCLGTHRFITKLVQEPKPRQSWSQRWQELTGTLSNRSFLALMVAGIVGAISGGLTTSLDLYFTNYYWELSPKQISYFSIIALLAAFIGVALAPPASKRFGKKPSMIGLFVLSTVTGAGPVTLRLLGWFPDNHSPLLMPILLINYLLVATFALTGFIIVSSMMADVVEDAAVVTGQRSEGLLFAANGLLNKCVTGLGTFLSGLLLAAVHFPQGAVQGHVDPLVLRHLALIFVPITVTCSMISIGVLLFYNIDRETHAQNLERLGETVAEENAVQAV
jgi:Na+/melibiose symporter-like transporter